MITLEFTLVDHMTGRDGDQIFLVGDRFTVTSRNIKCGEVEREVTVINDGLCRHDGYFVAESYKDVRDIIANKIITASVKGVKA
jgi:enolase